jgi:DNA-binding CsgD family transcriptional regulator
MHINSKGTFQPCTPCEFKGPLGRTVLNSLSAHIAVLDVNGHIIETNRAWQNFARSSGITNPSFIGINYLAICDAASGKEAADAHAAADGIRAVIRGEVNEFLYDYPCHSPTGKHWFYMRALRLENDGPLRIIISHEDITALKLAEEALTDSKRSLEEQKQNLEEANIALKVLLKQRENDKLEMAQNVLLNIKNLVFPYLEKLKIAPLRPKDKIVVGVIESRLNDIISPLLQRSVSINILLTPQEMQIATFIKDGKSSKEIAGILNVSETTVHFHRKNLRKKFGLKKKAVNLRSYLLSLS